MSTKDRQQIKAVVRAINKVTEKVVVKITLDIVANLIQTNPVDTGWSRANWVPNIGGDLKEDLSGIRPTADLAQGQAGLQSRALGKVAGSYKLKSGAIFISNNVPYVTRLNAGSSAQAPAGFVQRAISKAVTQDIRSLKL